MGKSGYETTRRIIELVRRAEKGEKLTIASVKAHFGIEKATAQRYLRVVKDFVALSPRARGGRKVWEQPQGAEVVLLQSVLVELGAQSLSWLQGTRHMTHLVDLTRTLRSQLDASEQDALDRLLGSVHFKQRASATNGATVDALLDAIRERRQCRMEYEKLTGEVGEYLFEPWSLVVIDGVLCVFGRKMPEKLRRTFEVAGVRGLQLENTTFDSPPRQESDPAQMLSDSVGTYASDFGKPTDIWLRVRGRAAVILRRRKLHPTQTMDDGATDVWNTVRLKAIMCPELVAMLLGLLPDVRVVQPDDLRRAIAEAASVVQGSDWDPSTR
jgi:predicted DNA-binding transcriptional regulator YafY